MTTSSTTVNPSEIYSRLRVLLAPQGIITFTTGTSEIGKLLAARYGTHEINQVYQVWRAELEKIPVARVVVLGVPMDCGAGFERGSFKGPLGIRRTLEAGGFYEIMEQNNVLDIGDVYVNPSLIDDSYYTDELKEAVRRARRDRLKKLDPEAYETAKNWDFPVSPHSAYHEALHLIHVLNPNARFAIFGGDHSISRIPITFLTSDAYADQPPLGILHFDAHTDLLDRRDGTPYNFATWAYQANDLIGRNHRLVQVGVRVSGKSREAWESELDITQIRMDQLDEEQSIEPLVGRVVATLQQSGAKRIFISNDIDGTDPVYAASTGTMEKGGLKPEVVRALISAMGEHFEVVGGDIVEVAPPLNWHVPGEPQRTLQTSCSYFVEILEAILKTKLSTQFDTIDPVSLEDISRKM